MTAVNCSGAASGGNVGALNCFTSVQYFRSEVVRALDLFPLPWQPARPTRPARPTARARAFPRITTSPRYRLGQAGSVHLTRWGQDWPIVLLDAPGPAWSPGLMVAWPAPGSGVSPG